MVVTAADDFEGSARVQQPSKQGLHGMLVEILGRYDTYGDGTISCVQLSRALERLSLDKQSIDVALASADGRGNENGSAGRISYSRFASWVAGFHEEPPEVEALGPASLKASLESGNAVLLKASWIIQLAQGKDGVLPCRNDLPSEALWTTREIMSFGEMMLQQLKAGNHMPSMPIVSVSLEWLCEEHPDPRGEQLAMVATALTHLVSYISVAFQDLGIKDCAVFIDWCSLQTPPRADAKASDLEPNLGEICLWYGHPLVRKLLIRRAPAVEDRNLTFLQTTLSGMITQYQMALRLGNSFSGHRCEDWASLRETCLKGRPPPLAPEVFARLLDIKTFTEDAAREAMKKAYATAFEANVCICKQLIFSRLGWGDKETHALAGVLPHCAELQELYLDNNSIGDSGAMQLAQALPHCTALKEVLLANNRIGDLGAEQFAQALRRCRTLERLEIQGNRITLAGAKHLATALPELGSMRDLLLQNNDLGDEGVQALVAGFPRCGRLQRVVLDGTGAGPLTAVQLLEALPGCSHLELLHLERNQIDADSQSQLQDMWLQAGKPERCGLNGRSYPSLMF